MRRPTCLHRHAGEHHQPQPTQPDSVVVHELQQEQQLRPAVEDVAQESAEPHAESIHPRGRGLPYAPSEEFGTVALANGRHHRFGYESDPKAGRIERVGQLVVVADSPAPVLLNRMWSTESWHRRPKRSCGRGCLGLLRSPTVSDRVVEAESALICRMSARCPSPLVHLGSPILGFHASTTCEPCGAQSLSSQPQLQSRSRQRRFRDRVSTPQSRTK